MSPLKKELDTLCIRTLGFNCDKILERPCKQGDLQTNEMFMVFWEVQDALDRNCKEGVR